MKPLGRPKKIRTVNKKPQISQFSPRGKTGRPNEIQITLDQFEAIRLADYQGYKQKEAAKHMAISRQTFGRVLKEARKRLATGLADGKIIKIAGGQVRLSKSPRNPSE